MMTTQAAAHHDYYSPGNRNALLNHSSLDGLLFPVSTVFTYTRQGNARSTQHALQRINNDHDWRRLETNHAH
jgi:hypothetical protein